MRSLFHAVSVSAVACLGIASQVALSASEAGTLQVGHAAYPGCSTILSGYNPFASIGSYSPTGLTGGETVTLLFDSLSLSYPACPAYSQLKVSGFASEPGKFWLTSVACNGVTNPVANATYTYLGGGVASWQWSQMFGLTWLTSPANVSCTIVHN